MAEREKNINRMPPLDIDYSQFLGIDLPKLANSKREDVVDESNKTATDGYATYLDQVNKNAERLRKEQLDAINILDEAYKDYVPRSAALSGLGGIANMALDTLTRNRAFQEDPMTRLPAVTEVQFKSPEILPGYESMANKSAIFSLNAAKESGSLPQNIPAITAGYEATMKEGILKQAEASSNVANAQETTNAQLKEQFAGRVMQKDLEDARRIMAVDSQQAQLDLQYRQMASQGLANLTQVANNAMIAPLEQQSLWFEKYGMLPSSIYNKSANR